MAAADELAYMYAYIRRIYGPQETPVKKPIEAKTQAGSLAAAVSGVVLWILQTYVFKGGMPQGVESLVYLAVPGVLAGAAAYLAPHTPRPDLKP